MKLRYLGIITVIPVFVSMIIGLVYKQDYEDFNNMEDALYNFKVGLFSEELVDYQLNKMQEELINSNYIIKAKCLDTLQYMRSCSMQKVKVETVYSGEGIEKGDEIFILRQAQVLFFTTYAEREEYISMNMGYVNEMIPGESYLIFLDRKLNTYSEKQEIYKQSYEFMIAPIFCYKDLPNTPIEPPTTLERALPYEKVAGNEFFLESQESINKMLALKELLLKKYP